MADEQAGAGQVLQGVAALVAIELVVVVAGEPDVAEDQLAVGIYLGATQFGDSRRIAHQYAGIAGQRGGAGIGQTGAFLAGFVEQVAACPGVSSRQAQRAGQCGNMEGECGPGIVLLHGASFAWPSILKLESRCCGAYRRSPAVARADGLHATLRQHRSWLLPDVVQPRCWLWLCKPMDLAR
ncbi:hypothetical protein D9M71_346690 [compost metagenome]